ncbi:MAG: hypothetical protein COB16_13695 [Rhodobacteraceae bacterium]|nr:MAG: hypothetical protein COB16_13695 [Paracoccaceae bacterium]
MVALTATFLVTSVSDLVTEIADGVQTQSLGLEKINWAMRQLDRVTQQNITMVEETSASSQLLQREAQNLLGIVSRFEVGNGDVGSLVSENTGARVVPHLNIVELSGQNDYVLTSSPVVFWVC